MTFLSTLTRYVCVSFFAIYPIVAQSKNQQPIGQGKAPGIKGLFTEISTLSDAQKIFGKADIKRKGEAGDFEASLCYFDSSGVTLKFISTEMGGPELVIQQISLEGQTPEKEGCQQTNVLLRTIAFSNGLKLGLTQKAVERILGQTTKKSTYEYQYSFYDKITLNKVIFDDLVNIHIRFFQSKVTQIKVYRIVTH